MHGRIAKNVAAGLAVLFAASTLTPLATAQTILEKKHREIAPPSGLPAADARHDTGAPGIQANVISDGSFAAGTPNPSWTEASTNYATPLCDPVTCGFDLAATGAWYAWFGGIAAYEEGSLSQTVAIAAASTATLTFQLSYITCNDPADFLEVLVDGNQEYLVTGATADCGGGYSLVSVNLDAYADGGNHTIELHTISYGTSGNTSNILVDDVALDVESVPVGVASGTWSTMKVLYR